MKTMLGGFADGRAPPEAARIANPIVPAATARRISRRVTGSLRANTIGPPLGGCNLIYAGALFAFQRLGGLYLFSPPIAAPAATRPPAGSRLRGELLLPPLA